MFKHKERDDEIRPSTGLMKWINKFFRFILYPFIHPKAFMIMVVLVVVLALGVPYFFYKVQFADMPVWYKQQINKYYYKSKGVFIPMKDRMVDQYNKMLREEVYKAANVNSKKQQDIEAYDIKPQGQRSNFSLADVDNETMIEADNNIPEDNPVVENNDISEPYKEEATTQTSGERKNNSGVYFKRKEGLDLVYIDEPERITGRFTMINPNEVLVNDKEIFLYGTYVFPRTNEAKEAGAYMMANFDGHQADCYIGAYTEKNIATAICFIDGVSVNHTLVDKGWAQKISLY